MELNNLNRNSQDSNLNIIEQNRIQGGYSYYSGGASASIVDIYSVELERNTTTNSGKNFNFSLVFNRSNINVSQDPNNQIITSGDAKVFINGQEI